MLGLKLNHVSKRGPCLQRLCCFNSWLIAQRAPSHWLHVMIYILYKLTLKLKLSYLTAILIWGRFCNKVVSKVVFSWKIVSIRFIFLNRMEFGLFAVQLSRTDYQDEDNVQHTGSVIPRFGHSSWGTLSLPFISLIECIKIQKQIWFISIIIANKASKLTGINCHYIITE